MKKLAIIDQREAITRANAKIREGIDDDHPGLITRWEKVNYVLGGSFKFGRILIIAGASGSGKSYALNMIRDDFANKELNGSYKKPFKILSFCLEMEAADEIIRTYTGKLRRSYSDLLSSYEKLPEDDYEEVEKLSLKMDNDIIHYVEEPGNRNQIWNTIVDMHNMYPEHQLIITIDHTLLAEYLDEKSEVDLVSQLTRVAMRAKKVYGDSVIMVSQLNDKIEAPERRSPDNPHLNIPTKTDLHGSKAVYMAADDVWVVHRPETLGLSVYGPDRFATKDLVAIHSLKGRFTGNIGILRFRNKFHEGTLQYPYDE